MNTIDHYTPADLAEELGIKKRIVLNAIKRGELRCIKFSSKTFKIRSQDAAAWVTNCTKGTK